MNLQTITRGRISSVFRSGLVWLAFAKALSAACILIQAAVFSKFLPESEVQTAFYFLAVVSLIGQAAMAVPVILVSQYAWLHDDLRPRKYLSAFVLFLGSLVVLASAWLILPMTDASIPIAALLAATACVAAIPNLFSVERFALGDVKSGAVFGVLNVLLPQLLASIAAISQGSALAWIGGLAAGHLSALVLIGFTRAVRKSHKRPQGKRDPIKVNLALIGSTFAWLLFVWALPNLPRLALADAEASVIAAQLLVIASISFAVSNAFETMVAQLRRGRWLAWFEQEHSADEISAFVARESRWTSAAAAIVVGPTAIALFGAGHFILFADNFAVPILVIALLVVCDMLRSLCSISYLIAEAGRAQARLSPWIALTTLATGLLLAQLTVANLQQTFMGVAIILLLCCIFLGIRTARWTTATT